MARRTRQRSPETEGEVGGWAGLAQSEQLQVALGFGARPTHPARDGGGAERKRFDNLGAEDDRGGDWPHDANFLGGRDDLGAHGTDARGVARGDGGGARH